MMANLFAQFSDPNVLGSEDNPHVTLRYFDATGEQSQWYAISLLAGTKLTLDIDYTVSLLTSKIPLEHGLPKVMTARVIQDQIQN